ncbi:hypothetical protein [Flavobacterium sp.]|uniref:hypothetical protein n=1 Tax=Flavobacterium sp. TaxID=239 RepID=UPI00286CC42E|nr:hypothetical protein [Flavobacterium sp.]
METKNKTLNLKPIVVLLVLLLAGSLFYIYQLTTKNQNLIIETDIVKVEKQTALDSLSILKTTYDKALEENSIINEELLKEREKVVNLIEELKKSKGDLQAMKVFKVKYNNLQQNFKMMVSKDDGLKKINEMLIKQRDSSAGVVNEQKRFIDTLAEQNNKLKKTVEKASKLVITNIKTAAIREKSSGKQVETEKASRTNKLKICFTIAENDIAKSGEKSYYVQVIDPNNNVVGEKKSQVFGEATLKYSFVSKVTFKNKSVDVCDFLDSNGVEFVIGEYVVNLFDKNELVSKSKFSLK